MPDLNRTDSLTRLTLRLVAGTTSLAIERLRILGGAEASPTDSRLLHACIGAAAQLDHGVRRRLAVLHAELPHVAGRVTPALQRVASFEHARQLRGRLAARIDDLADLGRSEEAAGRVLATSAFGNLVSLVIERTAGSPELERAVVDATTDVSQSTLREIRTRGKQADAFADALLRRLLPRRESTAPDATRRSEP